MPTAKKIQNIENLISRQQQRLLLVRLQKDDFQALDDLLTHTHSYLYNILVNMLGMQYDANRVLNNAYLQFLHIRNRLDSHKEFLPILGRIVFEEASKAPRRGKSKKRLIYDKANEMQFIAELFRSLSQQQKIVCHFRLLGDMHYDDIAHVLRMHTTDVFSLLADARHLIFNSLFKKRLVSCPENISNDDQKVLLAHPNLDELKKYAPKISKKIETEEALQTFLEQALIMDTKVAQALLQETVEPTSLTAERNKTAVFLLTKIKQEKRAGKNDSQQFFTWRPIWRTAFALALAIASFTLWKWINPAENLETKSNILQNSTIAMLMNAHNEITKNSSSDSMKDQTQSAAPVNAQSAEFTNQYKDITAKNGTGQPEYNLEAYELIDRRKEIASAMTATVRTPQPLNPYAATLRKQDFIPSVAKKIKLWENFLETTSDSSMYFPHIIENLAVLYLQAADSSKDALHLADAVAWFFNNEQILASFYSDSVYTFKLDSLQEALRAARLGR
ncbi:MAG: hypothetical protein DWQ10_03970 [Calditrichaeota bacterium]|nr:MAG: hypothetical protein DWQ10_03970 [Calditrichota bacterium]